MIFMTILVVQDRKNIIIHKTITVKRNMLKSRKIKLSKSGVGSRESIIATPVTCGE